MKKQKINPKFKFKVTELSNKGYSPDLAIKIAAKQFGVKVRPAMKAYPACFVYSYRIFTEKNK